MKKTIKQKGFSLVELMVVVAIIGVLATIAIPRVNRFIAKSRTSEAQINLSSIYTFNKNFFLEFQGYTNSLGAMGYRPEGNLRYIAGFNNAATGPANYTTLTGATYAIAANSGTNTVALCPVGGAGCRTLNGANNVAPAVADLPATTLVAPFTAFTAGAAACLINTGGGGAACTFDRWTIDQDKTMRNTQIGID